MKLKGFLLSLFLLTIITLPTSRSFALDGLFLNIHTGMVQGSYSSPFASSDSEETSTEITDELADGGFSVMPSLNVTMEVFSGFREAYIWRTILAMDGTTGKMSYSYFGFGKRYYYSGFGLNRNFVEQGFKYTAKPKYRKYFGWDAGLSRVVVVSVGNTLSAVSTGIDFGGHWGIIRQFGENWGLSVELGVSYAYGFSSVAVTGMNIKALIGGTYEL